MTAIKISMYLYYFDIQYHPMHHKLIYLRSVIESPTASLYLRIHYLYLYET